MNAPAEGRRFEPDRRFWRDRKVAVTGATGFLGTHLTGVLADLGADLVVLVRDQVPPSPVAAPWWDRVTFVHGVCEDQALMERLLGEYEVRTLFHLAAQSQVQTANRNPVSTFEANIAGSWSVFEAARRSPAIEQVVTASSDKAYGAQADLPYTEEMPLLASHPYDVSKACADLLATTYHRTYDLPIAITRCGNFFGPGDRNWERLVPGTIRSFLNGERPVIRSDGSMVRDYLYVLDGAYAYLQLAEEMRARPELHGEAFNFSTESPLTVLELVDLIRTAVPSTLEPDVRSETSNEIESQFLAAEKARSMLGWRPRHTMSEAVALTVEWYRSHLRTQAT